jgi:ABC-type transporter Mla subunit MlaD
LAERKVPSRISNAEIKAGVFLTFCLALFIAMLFVLGKFGHAWRGRQELQIAFTQVNAMRPEAPVLYNGMTIGHVKQVKLVHADPALLAQLPAFSLRDLNNLPLSDLERENLRSINDSKELDKKTRETIHDRTMVLLTLDVLREEDTQRFHVDDEYRISGSLMGDSSVDIRAGNGQAIPPMYDRAFLGISGDMYTDLGKSISQVKDILASMAEIVGGEGTRDQLRSQVDNFDHFTARLENVSDSVQTKMPPMWNDIDDRFERAKGTLTDVEKKLEKMKPKLEDAMVSAQKAVVETRDGFAKSIAEAHEKVKSMRAEVKESQEEWRKVAAEYKDSIPEQIHNGRDWTEKFGPTVEKINSTLTRADDQLNKGIESTRAILGEYIDKANEFEATTYRLKKYPSSFANEPTDEQAEQQLAVWKRDLARRQFQELRNELDRIREGLTNVQASDHPRVSRIAQLISESDAAFGFEHSAPETPKKGRK